MNYGIYGKLPAHGDFLVRNLPQTFIDVWDEWLQCVVAGSRNILADGWLEFYLTSSVWRFGLNAGVIDQQCWAGILVPSVDSVGRYFPLTIAVPLGQGENLYALMADGEHWFAELQQAAISGLQEQLAVDDLCEKLSPVAIPSCPRHCFTSTSGSQVSVGGTKPEFGSLHSLAHPVPGSASLWGMTANENAPSVAFVASGLPCPEEYTRMLTGQWS
jgi:type VI secretion system protein ImpM